MGYDRKYGKVTTEFGSIPETEPVIVFRARDVTLPGVLLSAIKKATVVGSPSRHIELLLNTFKEITLWQYDNLDKLKIPASESSKGRLPNG